MSSHDAPMTSCPPLAGKSVHAPGHLSGGSHSEWDAGVAALVKPLLQGGKMATPHAFHDIYTAWYGASQKIALDCTRMSRI